MNRQKQRLRIKYGIGVRSDELMKRRLSMNNADEEMTKLEIVTEQKFSDFEAMCKDTNKAATNALREAEYWTRQRSKRHRRKETHDGTACGQSGAGCRRRLFGRADRGRAAYSSPVIHVRFW